VTTSPDSAWNVSATQDPVKQTLTIALVNDAPQPRHAHLSLPGFPTHDPVRRIVLAADGELAVNSAERPQHIAPHEDEIGAGSLSDLMLDPWSLTMLVVQTR
jgi:alpha-L-arabinofuranosidase